MQKKKVVLLVGSICIGIIMIMILGQFIFSVVSIERTKDVEDVPRTIFADINELDSIQEFTLISKQTDVKEGDVALVEKREYVYNSNNDEAKIMAYIFVENKEAKRKYCALTNRRVDDVALSAIRDSGFCWVIESMYDSKYCVLKDNCLLYVETKQGQKVISELIKILADNLSVVVDNGA